MSCILQVGFPSMKCQQSSSETQEFWIPIWVLCKIRVCKYRHLSSCSQAWLVSVLNLPLKSVFCFESSIPAAWNHRHVFLEEACGGQLVDCSAWSGSFTITGSDQVCLCLGWSWKTYKTPQSLQTFLVQYNPPSKEVLPNLQTEVP